MVGTNIVSNQDCTGGMEILVGVASGAIGGLDGSQKSGVHLL